MRPQLAPKVLFYAAFDGLGMLAFAGGAVWPGKKESLFVASFPESNFEAVLSLIGGGVLMLWAAAQILRKPVARQAE
ncbi:MAG: hypothetical protein HY777_15030 [Betaproteobacteria bacterium]|nr:hypothetical protein [Betaproteobacteria bacterium]